MTKIVRKPRTERAFYLEVPKNLGQFSRNTSVDERGEKVYTELDLRDAVTTAIARGRQQATSEYEAYRDEIGRGYERAMDVVEESTRQLADVREKTASEISHSILNLVYRLVDRVVRVEVARNEDALPRLLDELLAKLADSKAIVIRVSPRDCPALLEAQSADAERWSGFQFRPDEEISDGGCVAETETGCWDARVETQLEAIYTEIERAGIDDDRDHTEESEVAA